MIYLFVSGRTDLRLPMKLFLFSYHSHMRGKEGSRAQTEAGKQIVNGSLEVPKAYPVTSDHYYCRVNQLIVLANYKLTVIHHCHFVSFSLTLGVLVKCITKKKKPLQIFKTKKIQCKKQCALGSQTKNGEQTQRLATAGRHSHPSLEYQREGRRQWLSSESQNHGHMSSRTQSHGGDKATSNDTSM